ncbi:DUF1631 family protein [Andreprevotia chitinilytica]|uniref:DUF1631 family protein n=1 Tax=Andreprevotia chitinilytica TaxID=396808 RepID=UPI00055989CF|nr:DUF1631 family protein [Andreprevotia chitinilytica]
MDRNDLLAATRSEFLRAFAAELNGLTERCVQSLFERADHAGSMADQHKLLDARTVLLTAGQDLNRQLYDGMERLLNRSFQTAYSTFRPSFSDTIASSTLSLSLIDVSTVEGEIRLDTLTNRFRAAAEEPLRDLNIRVALLFEQENIKERENPFRPYLFSRCIATVAEGLSESPETAFLLTEHLAFALVDRIGYIYERLNALLAQRGIAAELQLKVKKMPSPRGGGAGASAGAATAEAAAPGGEGDAGFDAGGAGGGFQGGGFPGGVAQGDGTGGGGGVVAPNLAQFSQALAGQGRVESLIRMVQSPGAAGPQTGGGGSPEAGGGAPFDPAVLAQLAQALNSTGAFQAGVPPAGADKPKTGWLSGAHSVGGVLRSFFSGAQRLSSEPSPLAPNQTGSFMAGMSGALAESSPLVNIVQELQQVSAAGRIAMVSDDGAVRNLILEERPRLSGLAGDSNEQMIIDIVGMLFEFILRDGQVPAEVRAQLGRLQFLVLKIALLDPDLFSHKNHPARMLVNRIGTISAGLQKVDPSGERVVEEIRKIIETLLAEPTENVSLFTAMLDELDAFIAHELRMADAQVDRAVQVLENAESRTLQFARTTAMIADGLSGLTLDPYLRDFLVNTWALVIERAGRDDPGQAEKYKLLIPDLIWSIAPKVDPHDRKQLFALIPSLLPSLQEGLAMIGWSTAQQQELVHWLVDAHKDALRPVEVPAPVPPLSMMHDRFEPVFSQPISEMPVQLPPEHHVLDSRFLGEAIQELEADLHLFDQLIDADHDGKTPPPEVVKSEVAVDEVMLRMQNGVTVEINLDGKMAPARLNWVSPDAKTLILTMDESRKPAVISVKVFRRMLASGRAHLLEVAPLFERAVQSLLESADKVT